MYFDKFDICEAYYLFGCLWHSGGDTPDRILDRLERMRFRPSPTLSLETLTENGAEIFNHLEKKHPSSRDHRDLHSNLSLRGRTE